MIGHWLELPVALQFLLLAAFYLITGTVIHLLSFHGFAGRWFGSFKGIVGPFFTSVTVIFVLLAAFIANDVWRRDAEASQVVRAEADALLAIAVVHLERPRPQIGALAIFSAAVIIALGLVAVQEGPFVPPLEVPLTALEDVLQVIPAR